MLQTHQKLKAVIAHECGLSYRKKGDKSCRKAAREKINCPAKDRSQTGSPEKLLLIKRQVRREEAEILQDPNRLAAFPCTDAFSPSRWKSIEDSGVWLVSITLYKAIG